MCKIVAISNGKGGCGKTTTTWNLGYNLSKMNYKVLEIDMDQQASLSLSNKCKNHDKNFYKMIKEDQFCPLEISDNFFIIPSSITAGNIPQEFSNKLGKELMLKDILDTYRELYDYILIDCPPQFTLLTDLAYTAADSILVPVSVDMYSIDGLVELNNRVKLIKRLYNPELTYMGILMTNAKLNTNAAKDIQEMLNDAKQYLGTFVYDTIIRNSVVVPDAQKRFEPLINYKKGSEVTKDYLNFTQEFLEIVQ